MTAPRSLCHHSGPIRALNCSEQSQVMLDGKRMTLMEAIRKLMKERDWLHVEIRQEEGVAVVTNVYTKASAVLRLIEPREG